MRRTGSGGGGEIVEVQGGHIVRSIGRKDRHSKVCTAKGPRDRRVRLSAHTAIQFYDVQDRLGYDRPSKAVDWLINKAKAAIDELAELPAWNPNTVNSTTTTQQETPNQQNVVLDFPTQNLQHTRVGETLNQSFLPPSLDSDSIADTIKSFFPTAAEPTVKTTSTPSIQFHNYPPDLISRTSSQNQDLRLSLQSFHSLHRQQNEHALFSSGFDLTTGGWSDHNSLNPAETEAEIGRFSRLSSSWNAENGGVHGGGGGGGIRTSGYLFNSSSPNLPTAALPPFFSENQFFSQRGPLQSSNTPSIRAWIDPSITDHQHNHHHQHQIQPSSYSALGFASGGFSGFHIPTRIQGEEEHDGISDKPSSASSDSHH